MRVLGQSDGQDLNPLRNVVDNDDLMAGGFGTSLDECVDCHVSISFFLIVVVHENGLEGGLLVHQQAHYGNKKHFYENSKLGIIFLFFV